MTVTQGLYLWIEIFILIEPKKYNFFNHSWSLHENASFASQADQCHKTQKGNDRYICCNTLLINHLTGGVANPWKNENKTYCFCDSLT